MSVFGKDPWWSWEWSSKGRGKGRYSAELHPDEVFFCIHLGAEHPHVSLRVWWKGWDLVVMLPGIHVAWSTPKREPWESWRLMDREAWEHLGRARAGLEYRPFWRPGDTG